MASDHNYTSLYDVFPQLQNGSIGDPPKRPLLGGQNFTYCCVAAVIQFIEQNGNSTDIRVSSRLFEHEAQFPCAAMYAGDDAGAPEVRVSYHWTQQHCPGWQISRNDKLSQWLQPLVGFLLPAVIFSLNVPRRRRLNVPDWLFPPAVDTFRGGVAAAIYAVAAITLAITDTIIWLFVVFAINGPLLLSGLHEAWIDQKIVFFMRSSIENRQLPIALRVRCLAATLVANLDMSNAWPATMSLADGIENDNVPFRIHPIRDQPRNEAVYKIQDRLRSMLECQYSFGLTVGAPVAFYMGSFIFAIREIRSVLGDNDAAHALAFGLWWTTIPLVAIVSAALLGGNNPNTLEGIVAPGRSIRHTDEEHGFQRIFRPTYDAVYRPAWMWFRGRSKKKWIERLCSVYKEQYAEQHSKQSPCPPSCTKHARPDVVIDLEGLERAVSMNKGDWSVLAFFTLFLLCTPCFLGFTLAYYTPQIGLSCRSLTFAVYAGSQAWLIFVWLYDLHLRSRARQYFHDHKVPNWVEQNLYFGAIGVGFAAAIFTAIGGTLMQILGVYRNAKCKINVFYWKSYVENSINHTFRLSSNNAIDIYEARHNWTGLGAGGIAYLGVICYLGWWYQRRLRTSFKELVEEVDTCKPSGGIGATQTVQNGAATKGHAG